MSWTRHSWTVLALLAACSGTPAGSPGGGGGASVAPSAPASVAAPASAPASGTPAGGEPVSSAAPSAAPVATPAPVASADAGGAVRRFEIPVGTSLTVGGPTVVVGSATGEGQHHAFSLQSAAEQGTPCAVTPRATGGKLAARYKLEELQVGATQTFWVNTGDFTAAGDRLETCDLKIVTPDLYVFLDRQANAGVASRLQAFADTFSQIKPRDEATYGAPPGNGPDGESRVFLVVSPAVNNFGAAPGHEGYFWARDLIDGQEHANQHRALFVADDFSRYPEIVVDGILAHEYQHLINFTRKTAANGGKTLSEDSWLDEGMAVYAQEAAGYGLAHGDRFAATDVATYEAHQADYGLLDWTGNPQPAFGQSYLFVHYLVDRFGLGVLRELVDNPQTGQANVDTVLGRHGSAFVPFFRDWILTNYLNRAGDVYHYNGLDLGANVGGTQLPGFHPLSAPPASLRPFGSAAFGSGSRVLGGGDALLVGGWF